ncbi:DUF5069 domain-containing protein [Oleiharenicola lentus]|uniref:DUF5069 domain-containing protein n=1 Tax=Oleiharenicola lentus TaxID=2508720 RepID=UPI003F67F768
MAHVPGLRSNYDKVGGLVYFGRMLDKIRLHAAGTLPADYQSNLGIGFDGRILSFLRVDYAALRERVLAGGGDDEDVLAWCYEKGGARHADEIMWFNNFLSKRGWRDEASEVVQKRIVEFGLVGKPIETIFDLNEYDEGRDPVAAQAWTK